MDGERGLVRVVAATIDKVELNGNVQRDTPREQLALALAEAPPPYKTGKVKPGRSRRR